MPKLVIKNELPPPSAEDRLSHALQTLLSIILPIIILIALGYFYFSYHSTLAIPQTELSTQATIPADAPAAGVKLPADFCPLFGPNAGSCKKDTK